MGSLENEDNKKHPLIAVDHDHKTGAVIELGDYSPRKAEALAYLEKYK
jgi:hypothetical protein